MYYELLQAIKNTLELELKDDLDSVKIMGGGFNGLEDIKNFADVAPSIGVGIEGIGSNVRNNANQLESMCDLSLFVITSDDNKENAGDKEVEAYKLLAKINLLVMNGGWGLKNVYSTEQGSITCNNFHTPEIYKNKICLWEINWKQKVLLGKDRFEEIGVFPSKAKAITDLGTEKQEEVYFEVPADKVGGNNAT